MKADSWLAGVVHLFVSLLHVQGDLFTAVASLDGLLRTEEEVVEFVKEHIQIEEIRIQKLRIYLQKYEKQIQEASPDFEKYVQNPVNAFVMIKRLSRDWDNVEKLLSGNHVHVRNFLSKKVSLSFPTEEDLTGAADGLIRLQDTYKLESSALARGDIPGSVFTSQLTADDCYELGVQASLMKDYSYAILWLQEALERIKKEKTSLLSQEDILQELDVVFDEEQKFHESPDNSMDLHEIDADRKMADVDRLLVERGIEVMERGNSGVSEIDPSNEDFIMTTYEKLCRGETLPVTRKTKELTCRFTYHHNLFYLLQPFKEETTFNNPGIVLYHELINDEEIKILKEISGPRLSRANVLRNITTEYAEYRISKSAWIYEKDHSVIEKMNRRIEAVTGLILKTAEPLQVANYGIGGHYEPHHDYATKEDLSYGLWKNEGNRIATLMFYMSDVESGGATVFPYLGVTIWPEKGSAVFWYNLNRNGDTNQLTLHAACPVLVGSKWVANKWFHESGQEFNYPCGLQTND